MKITDILRKITNGETLTQEESEFAASYQEPAAGGIPKDRLDREIQAKKDAEARAEAAEKQSQEIEQRLKTLEDSKLSDAEKAEKERKERDEATERRIKAIEEREQKAVAEAEKLRFRGSVTDLAKTNKVEDVETLLLYAEREKLNFEDEAQVSAFIETQKTARPFLFNADVKPGSGTSPGAAGGGSLPIGKLPKTVAEKAAFVREHGQDAYVKLAESESAKQVEAIEQNRLAPATT